MRNGRIGTLHLSGEDARNFAHSFFCPSAEEITEYQTIRTIRNESVTVRNADNGFVADVADLDLSFLEDDIKEEQVSITVTLSVKNTADEFTSTNADYIPKVFTQMVVSAMKMEFSTCNASETTQIAA